MTSNLENSKAKNKVNTKDHILMIGHKLVTQKGFTALGLVELLKTAGVPKGSFYHYFESKEQFGQAVIEAYFSTYLRQLDVIFANSVSAKIRLLNYFTQWQEGNTYAHDEGGCLVVKLSAEVADLSDTMREALHQGCQEVIRKIAAVIENGYQDGSIFNYANAHVQAQTLYYLWLGADLSHKLAKEKSSLAIAMMQTQAWLERGFH